MENTNKTPYQPTYRIDFRNDIDSDLVTIADNIPNMEDAVQFALNLHRSSNVKHNIIVWKVAENPIDNIIEVSFCNYI